VDIGEPDGLAADVDDFGELAIDDDWLGVPELADNGGCYAGLEFIGDVGRDPFGAP
jgi:hypothetical protein